MRIDPSETSIPKFHGYLLGAIAPRPIAFASTIDKEGNVNLSPFSFFNAFSANPPILVFSPARRVKDNNTKHTLENAREVAEVCINIVSHEIVEQMSLSSTEYGKGTNEFIKSGLTEKASEKITPPRVLESPASFECKVVDIIELGKEGGAGNLVICEVLLAHIADRILDSEGRIDPKLLDAVGRMGGDWYSRSSGDSLFQIAKPLSTKGIGVDQIPVEIRNSTILTGNDLGKLGNIESLPDENKVIEFRENEEIIEVLNEYYNDRETLGKKLQGLAHKYLQEGKITEAWLCLLQQ
jgi:flavin reductase (DIM6/NTAB) family NADH-FMN oxidoreductase RutF